MLGKVFHDIYFHKMWSVGMALIVGICEMWAKTDWAPELLFQQMQQEGGLARLCHFHWVGECMC